MIVKTYSHVVEFSIPSGNMLARTDPETLVIFTGTVLTVCDHEKVNSQDSKALAHLVVGVLELALHHCSIYLNDDNAGQSGKYHWSATPLIRKELRRDSV